LDFVYSDYGAVALGGGAGEIGLSRYSQLPVRSGLTGAEVAAEILRRKGVYDVAIAEGEGMLGDHYDPLQKLLVLSPDNFHGAQRRRWACRPTSAATLFSMREPTSRCIGEWRRWASPLSPTRL